MTAIEWTDFLCTNSPERKTGEQGGLITARDHSPGQVDADAEPRSDAGDDQFVHDVSWLEWFLGDVLRVKIPRSRCGEPLVGDPDRPDPMDFGAPMCPRCAELAGYDQADTDRFNRRTQ